MNSDPVRFKGMGDGVRINIDEHADMRDITEALEEKLQANKAFFGDGDCRIYFAGRRFSAAEKQRVCDITKALLPKSRISYEDEGKQPPSNDWIVEYKERHSAAEHPAEKVIEHPKRPKEKKTPEEEFYSVFRSNRARLYQGIVHEGMTIRSDGHLILFGMAEPGAELIAVGNILVIGGLYGAAHAGCNGHNGSYIFAMDMQPELLKIASVKQEYTYDEPEPEPPADAEKEKARRGIFDRLKKKQPEEEPPKEEKSEFPAVALLKNNKIEVDNFTIQTFTNPKNMV